MPKNDTLNQVSCEAIYTLLAFLWFFLDHVVNKSNTFNTLSLSLPHFLPFPPWVSTSSNAGVQDCVINGTLLQSTTLNHLSVDLKAISFPIYPQLFCELFTNQYLMINGLGHVMQIQRDPVFTFGLKKTFSSTCGLSLVVKNSNWRQWQYCDVVKTSPPNLQTESGAATLHVAVVIFTLSQYRQNQPSDEGRHRVACEPGSG